MKNKREYRSFDINIEKRDEGQEPSYYVEGYASTFDPYCLWKDPETGTEFYEQIARDAFDDTDMSDVVFRVDHEGKVYARTSNGLISLSVDDGGLRHRTDLGSTQSSRDLFDSIRVGNYPKMSFAFTVSKDSYDRGTRTRTIEKIDKLYDISAVAFPANPNTSEQVSARDYFHGVMEAEKAERLDEQRKELRKKLLKLKAEKVIENDN